ncbi:MAG: Hsp20/alpha crystallin family protein, partial [Rubrobacteraceae bacterium]
MGNSRRNPFRGFVDTLSETNRARERWMTGNDAGEDRRRDHTTAWIPTTDIFAIGDDLVIRAE